MAMFRLVLFALCLLVAAPAWSQSDFDNTRGATGSGEVLAFVGERISVERNNPPPEPDVIYLDGRYAARYRVKDVLRGTYVGETIDFYAYDHYGMPRFSKEDGPIVLYLYDTKENGWIHSKYLYTVVHPVRGGGWAVCDTVFDEQDGERVPNPRPQPIDFDPPLKANWEKELRDADAEVKARLEWARKPSDEDILELRKEIAQENQELRDYYAGDVFETTNEGAVCRLGLPIDAVLDHTYETRFRMGEIEEVCDERFPSPGYTHGDAQSKAADDKADADFKACTDSLLASGWPYREWK